MTAKASRQTRTSVDTIIVTPEIVSKWELPPFQRPLRISDKVKAVAEVIKANGGVIPGMITIGILNGKQYILDGQHRREAYLISGMPEGYVDVRYSTHESMADMGEEYVELNSSIVRMRPDDILRGLEGSYAALQLLRKRVPFVGYDMIRRSKSSPILGMSVLLRCWYASIPDVPGTAAPSAATIAKSLSVDDAALCAEFITLAKDAWGRDPEYMRLWGGLNLTLCMWLYRRTVLVPDDGKPMPKDTFKTGLMGLSTDGSFLDWLVGRNMNDHHRGPAFKEIKRLIGRRIAATGKRVRLPSPQWERER